ncbi:hypothetical protein HYH03_007049 [Edaphochlamys debaryana]|uniref:Uncharacterized protein n=1 Tax=Edaphochlamys debaryana TaxID=47281 RepID=A0A835Y2M4_9CHLO|nr:hypothetical protein HYH03_007049 [Edaphochlamys debaryana]|eukprot:KAG2494806.1 hypothetical protein HYH03_007049 [Edaphochlamys debaryana]
MADVARFLSPPTHIQAAAAGAGEACSRRAQQALQRAHTRAAAQCDRERYAVVLAYAEAMGQAAKSDVQRLSYMLTTRGLTSEGAAWGGCWAAGLPQLRRVVGLLRPELASSEAWDRLGKLALAEEAGKVPHKGFEDVLRAAATGLLLLHGIPSAALEPWGGEGQGPEPLACAGVALLRMCMVPQDSMDTPFNCREDPHWVERPPPGMLHYLLCHGPLPSGPGTGHDADGPPLFARYSPAHLSWLFGHLREHTPAYLSESKLYNAVAARETAEAADRPSAAAAPSQDELEEMSYETVVLHTAWSTLAAAMVGRPGGNPTGVVAGHGAPASPLIGRMLSASGPFHHGADARGGSDGSGRGDGGGGAFALRREEARREARDAAAVGRGGGGASAPVRCGVPRCCLFDFLWWPAEGAGSCTDAAAAPGSGPQPSSAPGGGAGGAGGSPGRTGPHGPDGTAEEAAAARPGACGVAAGPSGSTGSSGRGSGGAGGGPDAPEPWEAELPWLAWLGRQGLLEAPASAQGVVARLTAALAVTEQQALFLLSMLPPGSPLLEQHVTALVAAVTGPGVNARTMQLEASRRAELAARPGLKGVISDLAADRLPVSLYAEVAEELRPGLLAEQPGTWGRLLRAREVAEEEPHAVQAARLALLGLASLPLSKIPNAALKVWRLALTGYEVDRLASAARRQLGARCVAHTAAAEAPAHAAWAKPADTGHLLFLQFAALAMDPATSARSAVEGPHAVEGLNPVEGLARGMAALALQALAPAALDRLWRSAHGAAGTAAAGGWGAVASSGPAGVREERPGCKGGRDDMTLAGALAAGCGAGADAVAFAHRSPPAGMAATAEVEARGGEAQAEAEADWGPSPPCFGPGSSQAEHVAALLRLVTITSLDLANRMPKPPGPPLPQSIAVEGCTHTVLALLLIHALSIPGCTPTFLPNALVFGPSLEEPPAGAGSPAAPRVLLKDIQRWAMPMHAAAEKAGLPWSDITRSAIRITPRTTSARHRAAHFKAAWALILERGLGAAWIEGVGVEGIHAALLVAAEVRHEMLQLGRDCCMVVQFTNYERADQLHEEATKEAAAAAAHTRALGDGGGGDRQLRDSAAAGHGAAEADQAPSAALRMKLSQLVSLLYTRRDASVLRHPALRTAAAPDVRQACDSTVLADAQALLRVLSQRGAPVWEALQLDFLVRECPPGRMAKLMPPKPPQAKGAPQAKAKKR